MYIVNTDIDLFFAQGTNSILYEVGKSVGAKNIAFSRGTPQPSEIRKANILVKVFLPGEQFICNEELKYISLRCLVVGVFPTAYDCEVAKRTIPPCLKNMIVVNRNDNVDDFMSKVRKALSFVFHKAVLELFCNRCRIRDVTPQQLKVISGYSLGMSTKEIAAGLNIDEKTVSAHKLIFMTSFGLRNTHDLTSFVNQNYNYLFSTGNMMHLGF